MKKTIDNLYTLLDFKRNPKRYNARERHTITTMFLLSGLYCVVAVFFLLVFGLQSLALGKESYGMVLLGFAGLTVFIYLLTWYLGYYEWGGHLVVILFGALCLLLFYTGGQQGTGPLWYFVFPVLVFFVQGPKTGLVSVNILFLLTLGLAARLVPGIEPRVYTPEFLQRLASVYIAISALSYLFAYFRNQADSQLLAMNRELEKLSTTDKLSGLLNRRGVEEKLEQMELTYARFKMPFSLIIFDIDGFKEINDGQGHLFGDYVIETIGGICKKSLRKIDISSRWGGDEFLLLLPGTGAIGGQILAERIRLTIDEAAFKLEGKSEHVTVSLGVCEHTGEGVVKKTIGKADEFLYKAKQQGGNVVFSENTTDDSMSVP